ncbi:hypothetical protein G6W61_07975 [Streptomyces sp. KAI-26]|nr:hypothetical protein [Streptomyces sp. KAI-26]NUW20590.1 hypothetical protein [Streptomyces roseoviolaceus]
MLKVAVALPKVRRRVVRDLGGPGLTRERVLALGVRLLDLGFFRVGHQQYTQTNDSYGLTTVRQNQVTSAAGRSASTTRQRAGGGTAGGWSTRSPSASYGRF